MTRIDLGKCEALLRNYYNISINESLYIKKIDIEQNGMKTLKVEYEVYAKLFKKNLIKLNLTICEKNKISILIPIVINDHIDKFNSSSGYYNDICYTTTTEDGTDILLKDRQKEFISKDNIVCQENCDFSEYNNDTFVARCSCDVKECSKSFSDMNIKKDKLLENFKNIKNIINFNFLVCYKKLFNKEGILYNIGFYLLGSIILFHIITIFIFYIKQFPSIENLIKNIIYQLYEFPSIKEYSKDKKNSKRKKHKSKSKRISVHKNNKNSEINKKHISSRKLLQEKDLKISQEKKENIKIKYNDEEFNELSYNKAIQQDKRTFFQYYISLLKTHHNLICAFFNNNDYNFRIIKINLFFIGFSIEYTINALFYNDDTMHKIYKSKGAFDLATQIPIAIYSTIISMILNSPLNFLALSSDLFLKFKHKGTNINIMERAKLLKKNLFIKFILYFIISSFLLLFFLYYISMFGVIYKNTQIHLLKDTLISFGLSIIIPFITNLLPGILRISSLSNASKNRECLYNFSKFLQSL